MGHECVFNYSLQENLCDCFFFIDDLPFSDERGRELRFSLKPLLQVKFHKCKKMCLKYFNKVYNVANMNIYVNLKIG